MTQPPLNWSHGLNISDDEIFSIGLVVACFAHAENALKLCVRSFFEIAHGAGSTPKKWPWGFSDWMTLFEELAPIALVGKSDHLAVSAFLSKRGRELASLRNRAAHWLASRSGGSEVASLDEPWGHQGSGFAGGQIRFDKAVLAALAIDLNQWRADVFKLYLHARSPQGYQHDNDPWTHSTLPVFSRDSLDYQWPTP